MFGRCREQRNPKMKIEAAAPDARAILKIQEEFGDFDSHC